MSEKLEKCERQKKGMPDNCALCRELNKKEYSKCKVR